MTPAAGTRLFFIGSEGVLFSKPRQELHAFNASACVIWCHLEDGMTSPTIARMLASESGLDEATARAHVDAALADWTAKGLLADGPPVPLASPPPTVIRELPPPPVGAAAEVRTYRMLGVIARLRFAAAQHARMVDPLLAHMAYGGLEPKDFVVDIAQVGDGIGFWLDGEAWASCEHNDEVAPVAKAVVWTSVLQRQNFLMHVHAGAVGGAAGCVLLPAAPGSGKSTLTTGLVHAGFDLFSNEVALLGADLTVSPFPTAICVKDSGIEIIAHMYPRIRDLPIHRRGDGKCVAYLPPPPEAVPPDGHRRPVCGIVFPHFLADAAITSRRLPPAEALARLLGHCMNVGSELDDVTVGALVRWIEAMPCVEIEYGSLEPACEMIGAMLRGSPGLANHG